MPFSSFLERDNYVGILGANVGDVVPSVSDGRVSYEKLLALRSDEDTEVESVSTRSLRAARVGVSRSTQRGRHLERALPRIGANQLAPFRNAREHSDKQNARIEHDTALARVRPKVLEDDTELFKQFMDNEGFRRWLTDTVFGLTYSEPRPM